MSIESQIQSSEFNVKNLTLEQPETKVARWFDINKELNAEDRKSFEKHLEDFYFKEDLNSWYGAGEMLYHLNVLYGYKPSQLSKRSPEALFNGMAEEYSSSDKAGPPGEFSFTSLNLAAWAKQLFPEKFSHFPLDWAKLEKALKMYGTNSADHSILVYFGPAQKINPNCQVSSLLSREKSESIKSNLLIKKRGDIDNPDPVIHTREAARQFAEEAAQFKMIWPSQAESLELFPDTWKKLISGLHELKADLKVNDPVKSYALKKSEWLEFAANLKILAAKEIQLNDKGMHLVMEEEFLNDPNSRQLPEIKKF